MSFIQQWPSLCHAPIKLWLVKNVGNSCMQSPSISAAEAFNSFRVVIGVLVASLSSLLPLVQSTMYARFIIIKNINPAQVWSRRAEQTQAAALQVWVLSFSGCDLLAVCLFACAPGVPGAHRPGVLSVFPVFLASLRLASPCIVQGQNWPRHTWSLSLWEQFYSCMCVYVLNFLMMYSTEIREIFSNVEMFL